jgi:hypothetical protein
LTTALFASPAPTKEVFRILVATLDHDDANRTLTEAVVRAIQGETAIEAIETCRVLKIDGAGERIEEAAAKRGQEWLSWRDADVLVFGEAIGKGEALNLHFLSVGGRGDFHQHPQPGQLDHNVTQTRIAGFGDALLPVDRAAPTRRRYQPCIGRHITSVGEASVEAFMIKHRANLRRSGQRLCPLWAYTGPALE